MLRASGAGLNPDSPTEAHDVIVDGRGELSAVLVQVQSTSGPTAYDALSQVRESLMGRAPFYEVIGALKAWCSNQDQSPRVGVTLLRFAQPDARVELLVAGMPAVACVLPGGRVALHASLSGAVGEHQGAVHPYELSPLVWGSAWLLMSSGLTGGSLEAASTQNRVEEHALDQSGASLSGLSPAELSLWASRLSGDSGQESGSLVVVHADPTRRFESGII
jgi:hypothetical protein